MDEFNKETINDMYQAFDEIQMPRTPYMLENMVINSKFTQEQCYAQCVLEMSIAYDNLRIARAKSEIAQIEIDGMQTVTRTQQLEAAIKTVELEQLNRARLGAMREFEYLFARWQSFPVRYTRLQLNNAQEVEYTMRLETQAQQDMNALGRVSQGNQEGLRQIGRMTYPQLDVSRDVEKKYLETGKSRMLVVVPTVAKAGSGLPCLEGVEYPSGTEIKIFNVWGRAVDDAYNTAVQQALDDHADWVCTIEDDTFAQPDAVVRLMQLARINPGCAVGAWYPKRELSRQGVHIVLKDGVRMPLDDDGEVHEVYTLAMGCTIYPIEMFMKIPFPWFKTTANLSQDSFFSQLAREHGYKLLVDTSIKCKHVDRETGVVYE